MEKAVEESMEKTNEEKDAMHKKVIKKRLKSFIINFPNNKYKKIINLHLFNYIQFENIVNPQSVFI